MEYIRYLHPKNFDHTRGCFAEIAFKKASSDGCASIVQRDCVDGLGHDYCKHARDFYASVNWEPPVFWIFDEVNLPQGYRLTQKNSAKGDKCHYNLDNVSNTKLGRMIAAVDITNLYICANEGTRNLTKQDAAGFPR